MWIVVNHTPFAAERSWVRDRDGAEVWLVAVRGTFDILRDGSTRPAKEQVPVCMAPIYRGDPSSSSLIYESDMVHKKQRTDVLLHGTAYAPKGKEVEELDVHLQLVNINKTLHVVGDRVWTNSVLGVKLSDPKPFVTMPITYERAYGGIDDTSDDPDEHSWDPRNPAGRGFASRKKHLIDKEAPNIEAASGLLGNFKRPQPAGFGPIAGHWSQRGKYAGTYDEAWEKNRLPLLPDDFNDLFYQCAPEDQQTEGFLRGGEWVELTNLTPGGNFRFRLPRVHLRFRTNFEGGDVEQQRGTLHTVIIEPDYPRLIMVWHIHLRCHPKVLKLLYTEVRVVERIHVSEKDRQSGMWMG